MKSRSVMQSPPGPETRFDGRTYLYFGGTGYLGLASRPEVTEAACAAMKRYGFHSSTSRSVIANPCQQELEARAAQFFGTPEAFHSPSGYLTNQVMVTAMADEIDTVLIDEGSHYSAREAAHLADKQIRAFRFFDANDLERAASGAGRTLVIADAVSPATGAVAPIMDYLRVLETRASGVLLLDDAHGFGVLGEHGRGAVEAAGLWQRANDGVGDAGVRICVGGTLAKGLGGYGGIIPGHRHFIEKMIAAGVFKGASAPPSAVAAGSAKALQIAIEEPQLRTQLRANIRQIRTGFAEMGLKVAPGEAAHFGFSVGTAEQNGALSAMLKERGIILPHVASYSGVGAAGILRVAVFANHTTEQIERLVDTIRSLI